MLVRFHADLEIFLIAIVVLWCAFLLGKYYGRHKGRKSVLKELEQCLHDLTPKEKTYLSPYINENENTLYYKLDDEVSAGLEKKKIIYNVGKVERSIPDKAFNLQPWAKDYLSKNPHLLECVTKCT